MHDAWCMDAADFLAGVVGLCLRCGKALRAQTGLNTGLVLLVGGPGAAWPVQSKITCPRLSNADAEVQCIAVADVAAVADVVLESLRLEWSCPLRRREV